MMFDKLMELESELKKLRGGLIEVKGEEKDIQEERHLTLNHNLKESERKA